jgi:CBS domain-containing protein
MDTLALNVLLDDSSILSDLGPDVIKSLLNKASLETHPKGSIIYKRNGGFKDSLRIIVRGAVKVMVHSEGEDDRLVDYRGPGDAIGFMSISGMESRKGDAIAIEETTCYVLERDTVFDLLREKRAFAKRFFEELINRYISKPRRASLKKSLLYGGGERLLFSTPVGETVPRNLITASGDMSIKDAASVMTASKVGSLVIVDGLGNPTGIITDRDFRDRVVAKGRSQDQPVSNIQSVSLVKAEAGETCIEALFKMLHYNIRHILVVEGGRLKGILTDHDLLKLQGTTPLSIVQSIDNQLRPEGLADCAAGIRQIIGLFLEDGLRQTHLLGIVNELYDRLFNKVLLLIEKGLGPAPAESCFLLLGSAGRRDEALLCSVQAGILYRDPTSPEHEETCVRYFTDISDRFSDCAVKLGFESGGAGVFCGSVSSWKRLFVDWLEASNKRTIAASLPFFDMRVQGGNGELKEELYEAVYHHLYRKTVFLDVMASNIIKTSPPITAFKKFIFEKSDPNKGRFNLQQRGLKPLVDIVRFHAIRAGVRETSTPERLRILKEKGSDLSPYVDELAYSFHFLSDLCLQTQYESWKKGNGMEAWLDPADLNKLEEKALKQIFSFISRLQVQIRERHKPIAI